MLHYTRCTIASHRHWMRHLVDIKPGLVRQVARRFGATEQTAAGSASSVPVRCMVADKNIARGERICRIPRESILTGERASEIVQRVCNRGAAAAPTMASFAAVTACVGSNAGSIQELLASRDGMLLTLALFLLSSADFAARTPAELRDWVAALPPKAPPMGLLLHQRLGGVSKAAPLQRQLRIGHHTTPLAAGDARAEKSTDLMITVAEEDGLEAVRTPALEVVLGPEMKTNFFKGRRTPLTQRQQESASARTRHGESASVTKLQEMNKKLHNGVVLPLLQLLCAANNYDAEEETEVQLRWQERLEWAHFMLRSRSVNLDPRTGPTIALIPFVDMLNHAHEGPNVVYTYSERDGSVAVTAAKRIEAGEELTLHYGNKYQRSCLFGDADTRARKAPATHREAAQQAMESLEARQRREVDEDSQEHTEIQVLANTTAPTEQQRAKEEAELETLWLWRYGFLRSRDEVQREASQVWRGSLRHRIAHLTDVRRKGRPGEFVIGVPEGLQHLREQREQLERERYNNTKVFPPQRD